MVFLQKIHILHWLCLNSLISYDLRLLDSILTKGGKLRWIVRAVQQNSESTAPATEELNFKLILISHFKF